jgi:hypothetical protein
VQKEKKKKRKREKERKEKRKKRKEENDMCLPEFTCNAGVWVCMRVFFGVCGCVCVDDCNLLGPKPLNQNPLPPQEA